MPSNAATLATFSRCRALAGIALAKAQAAASIDAAAALPPVAIAPAADRDAVSIAAPAGSAEPRRSPPASRPAVSIDAAADRDAVSIAAGPSEAFTARELSRLGQQAPQLLTSLARLLSRLPDGSAPRAMFRLGNR